MDEMQGMLEAVAASLPEAFFRDLNGGILLLEEKKIAPEAIENDLYILGQYVRHPLMGNYIVIYYGSFAAIYGDYTTEEMQKELKNTLLHEFTHHLEHLAGEKGLEIEDALEMEEYFESKRKGRKS